MPSSPRFCGTAPRLRWNVDERLRAWLSAFARASFRRRDSRGCLPGGENEATSLSLLLLAYLPPPPSAEETPPRKSKRTPSERTRLDLVFGSEGEFGICLAALRELVVQVADETLPTQLTTLEPPPSPPPLGSPLTSTEQRLGIGPDPLRHLILVQVRT